MPSSAIGSRDIAPITSATHAAAVALARDHSLAFYDALILAAAIEAGCETLYSEDFQHGRRFGDLHDRQSVSLRRAR